MIIGGKYFENVTPTFLLDIKICSTFVPVSGQEQLMTLPC